MKFLVILFLLFLIVVFISTRYRKQITAAIYLWKFLQSSPKAKTERQIEDREDSKQIPLVKCSACGTWTPQKNSFNLNSIKFYCSKDCLKKAVKGI